MFWFSLLRENDIFCNFRAFLFKKHDFVLKFSLRVIFRIEKKYNASDFELKKIQRERF